MPRFECPRSFRIAKRRRSNASNGGNETLPSSKAWFDRTSRNRAHSTITPIVRPGYEGRHHSREILFETGIFDCLIPCTKEVRAQDRAHEFLVEAGLLF